MLTSTFNSSSKPGQDHAECVTGRIVTLDAMHTQRELCAQIHRLGGDYILIAKDNQPILREDIADLLEDRRPDRRRWNIVRSSVAPISTTGLANAGKALSKCFGSN